LLRTVPVATSNINGSLLTENSEQPKPMLLKTDF
jgi:hypothetical protein